MSSNDKFKKCCCRSKNIKKAERLVDLFVALDFSALIEATRNINTVVISGAPAQPPQFPNPSPPYAGTYTSNPNATAVQQALANYGAYVIPQNLVKGQTLFDCGFSRVVINVQSTSMYTLNPNNNPAGPISAPITVNIAFNFEFDRCGRITRIVINADNAEVVRFYQTA